MRNLVTVVVVLIAALILVQASCYIVDEREQVVVTEFGQPIRTVQTPGLNFKIPFIQQLHTFEDRLLYSDADPRQIYTQDKKNLIVDNFARWRIADPLKFLVSVQNVSYAQSRLDDIIFSAVREELGQRTLTEIVATSREEIMQKVTDLSRDAALALGIDIVDVRIKRADLPLDPQK